MPSATSHYIRCLAIDQHFRTQKADRKAFHHTRKLARKALQGTRSALGAANSKPQKLSAKSPRNHPEAIRDTSNNQEEIPKQPPRSWGFDQEASRKTHNATPENTLSRTRNIQHQVRSHTSWHREIYHEELLVIRKRFAIPLRNHFGVISGTLRGIQGNSKKAHQGHFETTSGHFWLFGKKPKQD